MKESIIRVLSSAISMAVGIGLAWLVYAIGGFSGTKTLTFLGLWFGFVAAVFFWLWSSYERLKGYVKLHLTPCR